MGKYRKKPVVIEAFLWTGDQNQTEAPLWIVEAIQNKKVHFASDNDALVMFIETLEGLMYATPGNWIIRGVKGEIYPCKYDIFKMKYEPVCEAVSAEDFNGE
jgi:hypothetical protein